MTSPTASNAFLSSLTLMTNDEDMQGILDAQSHMLRRFEKTNEMLSNFNSLSHQRYANVSQEFTAHTQLLLEMKSDLDIIFRRLRNLKTKLAKDYPRAFDAANKDAKPLDLGEDDEEAAGSRNIKSEGHSREPIQSTQGVQRPSDDQSRPEAAAEVEMSDPASCTEQELSRVTEENKVTVSEPPVYIVD